MTTVTIEHVSKADKLEQKSLLTRVDELLAERGQLHQAADRNFIEIGLAMSAVKQTKAWISVAHSWDAYVLDCGHKFDKGRTALYNYISITERLLPSVSGEQLIGIGISKAQALAGLVKRTGKSPSKEMLAKASNSAVGVDEFRAEVAAALHEKPENAGKWLELGGFWATTEEKQEHDRVMSVAREVLELPEGTSEWVERKAIFQALAAEFLSQHEPLIARSGK